MQPWAPGRHTNIRKDKDKATRGTRQTHKQEERKGEGNQGHQADTQEGGKIRTDQPGIQGRHKSRRKIRTGLLGAPGRHIS